MPTSDYTPTVADVGALVRARTRNDQGQELGTFDPTTRPTDTEAASLIQDAVNEAYPVLGENIPDDPTPGPGGDPNALRTAAKRIVALRAAALVELSYFPEQVGRGVSPYQQYMDSFEKGLSRLQTAIAEVEAGDVPGEDAGSTLPSYDFPVDAGGMVGWGSVW